MRWPMRWLALLGLVLCLAGCGGTTWDRPRGSGSPKLDCPASRPIKGAADGVYHQPGQLNYGRTIVKRCFTTTEDAKRAGYQPAMR